MSVMFEIMKSLGRRDAIALREKASTMTGTQLIDSEHCIPPWDQNRDYSNWPVGSPVVDEDQVWTLITPHNASHFTGRPSELRAIWSLAHTKDPKKAKKWVAPFGTSGMYMTDECYKADDGKIFRCKKDNTVYDAITYPAYWEEVLV